VRVFYITNRKIAERDGTARNLNALGFRSKRRDLARPHDTKNDTKSHSPVSGVAASRCAANGDNLNDFSDVFEKRPWRPDWLSSRKTVHSLAPTSSCCRTRCTVIGRIRSRLQLQFEFEEKQAKLQSVAKSQSPFSDSHAFFGQVGDFFLILLSSFALNIQSQAV
jgi:hypothetical protein